MHQYGLFDLEDRYAELSRSGDPLEQLNAVIEWKIFLPCKKDQQLGRIASAIF